MRVFITAAAAGALVAIAAGFVGILLVLLLWIPATRLGLAGLGLVLVVPLVAEVFMVARGVETCVRRFSLPLRQVGLGVLTIAAFSAIYNTAHPSPNHMPSAAVMIFVIGYAWASKRLGPSGAGS